MQTWLALDLETTGLSPTRHRIRELAVVPFAIHDQGEHLMRFSPADFQPAERRPMSRKLADVMAMIGPESRLVAHNAAFDVAFLAETLRRAGAGPFTLRAYCTLRLARQLFPELPRWDLTTLRQALGVDTGKPHTAVADARAVAAVFTQLVQRAGFAGEDDIRGLHGPPVQVHWHSAWKEER